MDYGPRPFVGLDWYRAHGLGNDYLVASGAAAGEQGGERSSGWRADPPNVRRVCDRNLGLGADGIIVVTGQREPFDLRAFNPDGSEFERSGNGLRIVASWLHRQGSVGEAPFEVRIAGDRVSMTVEGFDRDTGLYDVTVEMGRARVGPDAVGLTPDRLPDDLARLDLVPVSVGNPHVVVWDEDADIDAVGPALATSAAFEAGTNVQVARRVSDAGVEIDIWERGVGRTTASGSSSCAAAVAAVHSGRLPAGEVDVTMAGGRLLVTVDDELGVLLRGPVQAIATGTLDPGFAVQLE